MKVVGLSGIIVLLLLSSCGKLPKPCVTPVLTQQDTVAAGTTLTFNAACSENATKYDWKIVDRQLDSVVHETNNSVTLTYQFNTPGQMAVFLYLTNENNPEHRRYASDFWDFYVK